MSSEMKPLVFTYRNWRGEISERRVIPYTTRFGASDWHTEPQWLLRAWDIDKNAEREFAMKDMLAAAPKPPEPAGEVVADEVWLKRWTTDTSAVLPKGHMRDLVLRIIRFTEKRLYTTPPTPDADAIRRAALEEAAKVAERRHEVWAAGDGHHDADGLPAVSCDITACENIAAAIRALATQPSPDGRG